ncbi:MAG: fibrobacter succinogenes major paralogous domain-containing protein [Bacteroidetes bacterium]|nr:fibrobacter succinogenes major paralogous domain-containing protein [Bacteroidota bacterium]
MKRILAAITLVVSTSIFFSCKDNTSNNTNKLANQVNRNSITDTGIKIGKQIWSSFNLEVTKFKNGDEIFYAKSVEEWKKAGSEKKPAWCYYNDDSLNGEKYGKLYNWYAVNDVRGLAPNGWHIPTNIECEDLMFFLNGKETAGKKMKSKTDWMAEGSIANDNSSGFNALPAGSRDMDGVSAGIASNSSWWTANEEKDVEGLDANYFSVDFSTNDALIYIKERKSNGFSVRCIKNEK